MTVIHVIVPYQYNGAWVFDDAAKGLEREALVAGADKLLDSLIRDAGLTMPIKVVFSEVPFPSHQEVLVRQPKAADAVGETYWAKRTAMFAWLCPALFKFFEKAPQTMYVAVEPL